MKKKPDQADSDRETQANAPVGADAWVPPVGSWASSAARRRNMQAIRSRDTTPERLIRQLVHAQGLRYRVAARPLPKLRRTADMVFRPAKVAVFVDGCYWHGCPEHYVAPKTNSGYWSDKVTRNMARDRDTDQRLTAEGWTVLRFWEHEPPEECAAHIAAEVERHRNARRKGTPSS
ncbi:very short patch repair endonuclease [Streptomyces rubrogriseus]|uniref:very short patch repair endonuclease n=1 Tax=Streptomyces rubrogriseus TaxID=194673 RepID=UPI002467FD0A|nr:very short patch repair endonuclease [Streptomyces rubrogriseus]